MGFALIYFKLFCEIYIYNFFLIYRQIKNNLNIGGDEEDRTPDPLRARQVLSQLSYTPISDTLMIKNRQCM